MGVGIGDSGGKVWDVGEGDGTGEDETIFANKVRSGWGMSVRVGVTVRVRMRVRVQV